MPTYAYRCNACGHEFERVQRISEDPIRECPACQSASAQRQISGGNFILKGSGWYSDLYSGSSNKKGGSSASEASTKSESKSDSSSSAGACGAAACATGCAATSTTPSTTN